MDKTFFDNEKDEYSRLLAMMRFLRSDEGCPWDREQTHQSLSAHLLEEAWETVDAIESGKMDDLKEELGDLLLQVVFHAEIARQAGEFDMNDLIAGLNHKLISRHSHLFGEDKAETAEEVLQTWQKNKRVEKRQKNERSSLEAVPRSMPALARAAKIQKKAAECGFDWPDSLSAATKIHEETEELLAILPCESDQPELLDECGDLLFAIVNVLRHLKVEGETVLHRSTDKFTRRFASMERLIEQDGRRLRAMSLDEMDEYWRRVKEGEKKNEAPATGR